MPDNYVGTDTVELPAALSAHEEKVLIDQALGAFARKMREKLHAKADEGLLGWDSDIYLPDWEVKLEELVAQQLSEGGQTIDIANFAMFLWYLQERDPDIALPVVGKAKD